MTDAAQAQPSASPSLTDDEITTPKQFVALLKVANKQ